MRMENLLTEKSGHHQLLMSSLKELLTFQGQSSRLTIQIRILENLEFELILIYTKRNKNIIYINFKQCCDQCNTLIGLSEREKSQNYIYDILINYFCGFKQFNWMSPLDEGRSILHILFVC
ncbi:unnamed protein product [Paramecium octaurelia]|uniref:Uncharacterized protein n=1 Tax=Paramecium octaurelia TaxID=43137 RepID=A0A8S1UWF9_PAROT|nr:unnamed protein product [Paramecium octaurelia]